MTYNITVIRTQELRFDVDAPNEEEAKARARIMQMDIPMEDIETVVTIHASPIIETTAQDAHKEVGIQAPLDTEGYIRDLQKDARQAIVNEKDRIELEAQEKDRRHLEELDRLLDGAKIHLEGREANA